MGPGRAYPQIDFPPGISICAASSAQRNSCKKKTGAGWTQSLAGRPSRRPRGQKLTQHPGQQGAQSRAGGQKEEGPPQKKVVKRATG